MLIPPKNGTNFPGGDCQHDTVLYKDDRVKCLLCQEDISVGGVPTRPCPKCGSRGVFVNNVHRTCRCTSCQLEYDIYKFSCLICKQSDRTGVLSREVSYTTEEEIHKVRIFCHRCNVTIGKIVGKTRRRTSLTSVRRCINPHERTGTCPICQGDVTVYGKMSTAYCYNCKASVDPWVKDPHPFLLSEPI